MTVQPGSRIEGKPRLRAVSNDGAAAPLPRKFVPPRFPTDLVGLDAMADWLAWLAHHEIAVVRAPVGYGKTAWCAALFTEARSAGWRTAWLSIDPEDAHEGDDGLLFDALGIARPDGDAAANAAMLANHIDADDRPLLFILDDVDPLPGGRLLDTLDQLMRHPPGQLRLLLSSRARAVIDIAAAERRGMVLAIGVDELGLSDADADRFLRAAAGTPDVAGSADLLRLLQGWPAMLRIAARRRDGPVEAIDALLAPSLDALPDAARRFLCRCAVAPWVDAELGCLLGGDKAGAAMLGDLAALGLGFEAADGGYRFHPAVRAALLRRLDLVEPGRAVQLHRMAARHYAARGRTDDAIDQALACGDTREAAALTGDVAMAMVARGELERLAAWLAPLPDAEVRPEALRQAEAWLALLRPGAKHAEDDGGDAPAIDLLRRAYADDRPDDIIERCDRLLAEAGGLSPLATGMVRAALAQGAVRRGLFGLAHDIARTLLLDRASGPLDLPGALAVCAKAAAARAQGQLGEAEQLLRDGKARGAGTGIAAALIDAALARACYERDALDLAAALAEGALPRLEASMFQDALIQALLVAIRVAAGQGRTDRAAALIDRAELIAFARDWAPLKALCVVERARLRLPPTIDAEAVVAIADEEAAVRDPLSARGRAFALLAEMRAYEAIAAGDRPRLTQVAEHLLRLASNADDAELRASATLFNILPQLSGRCDKMVDLEIVRFLNHAASRGFRRTIVDVLDVTGVRAVQNFCSEAYASDCFLALLRLAEPARRDPALEGAHAAAPGEAFSFLTEREIEILGALNAGESNKEIARTLHLAPETVKWHLKNVMRKLRAGSRDEAVANATMLGLKLIEERPPG